MDHQNHQPPVQQSDFSYHQYNSPISHEIILERKELRKTSNFFGFSGIMFFGISLIISIFILIIFGGFLNVLRQNGASAQSETQVYNLAMNVEMILKTLIPIPLAFIIFARLKNAKISDCVPLNFENKNLIFIFWPLTLALSMAFNIVSNIIFTILKEFGLRFETPEIPTAGGAGGKLIMFIVISVFAGFLEEFAFRGIALSLFRKYGDWFAIIASAFLFGFLHGNVIQGTSAFVLGIFMGYAVVKTGTVWTSILIHTTNNFIAISALLLSRDSYLVLILLIFGLIFTGSIVAFVLLVTQYRYIFKNSYNQLHPKSVLSVFQKLESFCFSPAIISLLVLIVFQSVFREDIYQFIQSLVG